MIKTKTYWINDQRNCIAIAIAKYTAPNYFDVMLPNSFRINEKIIMLMHSCLIAVSIVR